MNATRHKNMISVLMFPWLAHGHISPFLELSKKLTKRNFHIYFCSTPINLSSIKQKLSQKYSLSIQLVEIHLPSLPELPPHFHTTNGLPPHLMPTLKKAFDTASSYFENILKTLNPDLIIYDFLQHWVPSIAFSLNIPAVEFICTAATMACFCTHLHKKPGIEFPFPAIYYRDYELRNFSKLLEPNSSSTKDTDRVLKCFELSNKIVLIKSFREIEGIYIDYLADLTGKKIVPVGPLIQEEHDHELHDNEKEEIFEWLDKNDKFSVVFVSFGSEYFLSKEELSEIAYGLELSNVNFIWVIRFHKGAKIDIKGALPKGFFEKIEEGRGLVLEKWAPQARILGHCNIGGFVSHCGWSSVMERIYFGVPIIAMPMHLDQPLNSRLVEEVGVGVEVKRDSDNGQIDREDVAKVIRELVVQESGECVRRKVKEMKDMLRNKGDREMDGVVDGLLQLYT
ncbi:Glycosyltransferase [Quillaja saponaria]|uniref:Glycosyltransferase n=1 Tax=Quillaja saponaria TaxID=32244 RepID=A0AAD7M6B0_QUISA|nr:Glycosyltransferase [Quillaja saponaria]